MPGVLQLAQLARMAAEDAEAAGVECELLGKFRTETTERETDRIISQSPSVSHMFPKYGRYIDDIH